MLGQVYQQKEHAISTKSWKSVANVTVIGVDTGRNLFHVVGSIVGNGSRRER